MDDPKSAEELSLQSQLASDSVAEALSSLTFCSPEEAFQ